MTFLALDNIGIKMNCEMLTTYFCAEIRKYSRTSMARTSLGPSSARHWSLFMVPGQETDGDNLVFFSIF